MLQFLAKIFENDVESELVRLVFDLFDHGVVVLRLLYARSLRWPVLLQLLERHLLQKTVGLQSHEERLVREETGAVILLHQPPLRVDVLHDYLLEYFLQEALEVAGPQLCDRPLRSDHALVVKDLTTSPRLLFFLWNGFLVHSIIEFILILVQELDDLGKELVREAHVLGLRLEDEAMDPDEGAFSLHCHDGVEVVVKLAWHFWIL